MKEFIRNRVRTALLTEARIDAHTWHRIKDRIERMSSEDLPPTYRKNIMDTFHKVRDFEFPKNKSYAVMLGEFKPKPSSEHYVRMKDGREYYRVYSDPILKDSTGNQFWVIIRDNLVHTFMLRKDVQTADPQYNNQKLDVDNTIYNLDKYIRNVRRSQLGPRKDDDVIKIDGTKWKIDSDNEKIFKKNKPDVAYDITKFLDKVDEPTQEKILSML